jgi:TPR repeat protein
LLVENIEAHNSAMAELEQSRTPSLDNEIVTPVPIYDTTILGYLYHCYGLCLLARENYSLAKKNFEFAKNYHCSAAITELGALYSQGLGVAQDSMMALKLYVEAALAHDANAIMILGMIDAYQLITSPENHSLYYLQIPEKGDFKAYLTIGALRNSPTRNFDKLVDTLAGLAEKGNADAAFNLALLSYYDHDFRQARHYFEKATALGHAAALSFLAEMHFTGKDTDRKPGKALRYRRYAAAVKEPFAIYCLAHTSKEGHLQHADDASALYRAAVEQQFEMPIHHLHHLFTLDSIIFDPKPQLVFDCALAFASLRLKSPTVEKYGFEYKAAFNKLALKNPVAFDALAVNEKSWDKVEALLDPAVAKQVKQRISTRLHPNCQLTAIHDKFVKSYVAVCENLKERNIKLGPRYQAIINELLQSLPRLVWSYRQNQFGDKQLLESILKLIEHPASLAVEPRGISGFFKNLFFKTPAKTPLVLAFGELKMELLELKKLIKETEKKQSVFDQNCMFSKRVSTSSVIWQDASVSSHIANKSDSVINSDGASNSDDASNSDSAINSHSETQLSSISRPSLTA